MKTVLLSILMLLLSCSTDPEVSLVETKDKDFESITERVNIQRDTAKTNQIIDNEWVAVGIKNNYSIQKDNKLTFNKKSSYRFELKEADNTLSGYQKGTTKGRAELSYCYATKSDFHPYSDSFYNIAQKKKTVYHCGKGSCEQGETKEYQFSIYVPDSLNLEANTIFAQWHGMPDRTLVQTPEGEVKKLSDTDFLKLYEKSIIKKNIVYHKIPLIKNGIVQTTETGDTIYTAGEPSGWLIEQGGYPPLAFGFSDGYFYIKANSDRKWLTDKTDRCNANVTRLGTMQAVSSEFKTSTIAYREFFKEFPKNKWVTFILKIQWSRYGKEAETILKQGFLDVKMEYLEGESLKSKHIVKEQYIPIGRNDEQGYYFKFGIYRVGNSSIPVVYNLAGYSEK